MFKAALQVLLPQIKLKTLTEKSNQMILNPDTDRSQSQDTSEKAKSQEIIRHNPGIIHTQSILRNFQN